MAGISRPLAWALGATVVVAAACGGSSSERAARTDVTANLPPAADTARATNGGVEDGPGVVTLRPVIACEDGTRPDASVGQDLLPQVSGDEPCVVGPPAGTGEVFERGSAMARLAEQTGQWVVDVGLRAAGQVVWSSVAQECFTGGSTCPSRRLAIVLDDVIQSAPLVQTPDFPGTVQISGDFSEEVARALARVLNRDVDGTGDDALPEAEAEAGEPDETEGDGQPSPVDATSPPPTGNTPPTTVGTETRWGTGFALPAMCGLPAADWTSNEHPQSRDDGPWATGSRVDGDLTGDGVDEIVWATVCGAGTVAAGRAVHVFDASHRSMGTLPVESAVADVYPDRTVHPLEPRIVDGDVQLEVWLWQSSDAACCPSVTFDMSFGWDGRGFAPTSEIPDPASVGTPTGEAPVGAWDGEYRPKTSPGRVVQLGNLGQQVERLQEALSRLGYDVDVDGYFGYGTEAAVRQFQRDRGLPVTGVATEDVWNEFGE